ncbi:MAG: hypothetical protein NVV66_12530 [Cellulomonas sp.]|uniref:hypothetical protein n=1 Tax=Cellulomonas sp. TaxID=40001 RepID=UPI002584593D|nr:hypothetical protein [Cellulomonas sp.]MCR6705468.1 hypothetical protein [Cellulomonas sp.]
MNSASSASDASIASSNHRSPVRGADSRASTVASSICAARTAGPSSTAVVGSVVGSVVASVVGLGALVGPFVALRVAGSTGVLESDEVSDQAPRPSTPAHAAAPTDSNVWRWIRARRTVPRTRVSSRSSMGPVASAISSRAPCRSWPRSFIVRPPGSSSA